MSPHPSMPAMAPRKRATRRVRRPMCVTPEQTARACLAAIARHLGATAGDGTIGDDEVVLDGSVVAYRRGADVRIHAVFAPSGAGIRTEMDGRWVEPAETFESVVADIQARRAKRAQYAAEFARRAADSGESREP